jgi:hypothetical protein
MSVKRTVVGRSLPFDQLVLDHNAQNILKKVHKGCKANPGTIPKPVARIEPTFILENMDEEVEVLIQEMGKILHAVKSNDPKPYCGSQLDSLGAWNSYKNRRALTEAFSRGG